VLLGEGPQVVPALRVVHGDLVCVRGRWREVTTVGTYRFVTGGLALVLVFADGPVWRVCPTVIVAVVR
jgi:hypothetical protein